MVEILFVWNYKTGGNNCSKNVDVSFIQITLVSISFAYLGNSNAAIIQQIYTETIIMVLV